MSMATSKRKTKIITFLSGKGGSGKTTLALSTAKLLCDCGLKVLLVDCDLATNGATYFFEQLYKRETVLTLWDILQEGDSPEEQKTKQLFFYSEGQSGTHHDYASTGFFFVPTNTYFDWDEPNWDMPNQDKTNQDKPTSQPADKDYDNLKNWLRRQAESGKYDAILCDCQAGYSPVLDAVLHVEEDAASDTFSCVNVIPLEQDMISATATRILYVRIHKPLDRDPTYIVFNKVYGGPKELTNLTNINVGGTIFPMLPPIQFYISVFQSFATGDIPDMLHTDADFGQDIHKMAMKLLPEKREVLRSYTKTILNFESKQLERREQAAREKRKELNNQRTFVDAMALIVAGGSLAIGVGLSGIVGEWMERLWKLNMWIFALGYGIGITALAALICLLARRFLTTRDYREDVFSLEKEMDELKEKRRQNDEKRERMEDRII